MGIKQALCALAKSVPGGHESMAVMLGYSKTCFQNRLYEAKGQALSLDDALLMQRFAGRTDFAEAVARESGGVFVPLPVADAAAAAGLDIESGFLEMFVNFGRLFERWRVMTEDGHVCSRESEALWAEVHRMLQQMTAIAVQTDCIYGGGYGWKK